ncbi:hypothetical protein [Streptomyces mangrovisoli]|uniref:Uncharacterized protein n=1 Tax=Streptomyces mangrovisoli TaxID=1428628 RepID=A0A1J4P4Q1_9ACTN|nr:hypothetical protein [Streptomyces mangrovisoli]OIJ69587.1 hypothetical protein WN71_001510 [Streptomyces mangrovisoli]
MPAAESGPAKSGPPESGPADSALAGSLLQKSLADPGRLPENLAEFAVRRLGPAARRGVRALPDTGAEARRARVITRGRRATVTEGAFVGGPFLVFIPVAFCAALLRQARTLLELAALDGRDPAAPERVPELLVLQGVYPNERTAAEALAAHRARPAPGTPRRRRLPALWDVTVRMARLLGLVTPGRGRWWAQAAGALLLLAVLLVGLVAPLVWLPYMAMSYDRATTRLMERAVRHYFGDAPVPVPRRRLAPGGLAALVRAAASLLLAAGLVLGALASDARIADSRWPVLGIVLVVGSLAVGTLWQRRHRRHH